MSDSRTPPGTTQDRHAQLDAWRASGVDRIDPIGFLRIAQLVQRLDAYQGEAQRVLTRRVDTLMRLYAAALEHEASTAEPPAHSDSALSQLLAQLTTHHAAQAPSLPSANYPALPWLGEFRETWSALSARRRLHDARDQVPKNAGPLNSNGLVHRALSVMQELSPEYLRSFLEYAESLAGLESLSSLNGVVARRPTTRGKTA